MVANIEKQKAVKSASDCALNWKSLIKNKLSPTKQKYFSSFEADCKTLYCSLGSCNDVKGNVLPLRSECEAKEKILAMEISPNSLEDEALENKAYCFIPILPENGPIVTNPNQTEMRNQPLNNSGGGFHLVRPNIAKEPINPRERDKLEEWECTGDILAEPMNRAVSVDLLRNRLYERSAGFTDARCSSNTDFASFPNLDSSMKLQEETVPATSSVWDYPSSWKEADLNVWNPTNQISQSYDNSSNLKSAENLTPFHQSSFQENDIEPYTDQPHGFEMMHPEIPTSENWTSTQNWCSFNSFNSKNDSTVFSNAFRYSPQTVYKEGMGQESKINVPETGEKNYKNIWSDLNDNITTIQNKSLELAKDNVVQNSLPNEYSSFGQFDVHKKTEEELSEKFGQLRLVGLEHLWRNLNRGENLIENSIMAKGFSSDSSLAFLNEPTKSPTDPILSEELYRLKCAQNKEMDESFFLPSIPSGPSGPYVDLKHIEGSSFRAVIPHERNLEEILPENVVGKEDMRPVTPKETSEASFTLGPTTQEDENLLTSPRTHFRPIRQDSHGSLDEPKGEDGQTVLNMMSNIHDSDMVFQRSGSGTLYLESDLLKGSPKKYMAYREPPSNVPILAQPGETLDCSAFPRPEESPSAAFVPKFKLVNNEKFCQTEGPGSSATLTETISKGLDSKILQNEMKKYDFLYCSADPSNIKHIWEKQTKEDTKEAWELDPNCTTLHYPKWSIQDLDQADWSNNTIQPSTSMHNSLNNALGQYEDTKQQISKSEKDPLSKIKFIWHNSKEKFDYLKPHNANASNSVNVATDFPTSTSSFSDSWNERHSQDVDPSSGISAGSNIIVPKSPWDIGLGLQKKDQDYGK